MRCRGAGEPLAIKEAVYLADTDIVPSLRETASSTVPVPLPPEATLRQRIWRNPRRAAAAIEFGLNPAAGQS